MANDIEPEELYSKMDTENYRNNHVETEIMDFSDEDETIETVNIYDTVDGITLARSKHISKFDGVITGDCFIYDIKLDDGGNIISEYGYEAMKQNTAYLQKIIDNAEPGSTIHLPAGVFYFAEGGLVDRVEYDENGNKRIVHPENYVIHMKDANNINIVGAGTDYEDPNLLTVLKPYSFPGTIESGLDMFYYNEHKDSGYANPRYIENVDFKDFVIDSERTRANSYTTAGKGFMLNLCRDCDWENVVVKNTDGTGFGMDMVVNCTIKNCSAINCGKGADSKHRNGASGFGIGTGYSEDESIRIENCTAIGNYKYGFFFEHQGRFNIKAYDAKRSAGFEVINCHSYGNYYNFGGERSNDVIYRNCVSERYGDTILDVHFSEQSRRNYVVNMATVSNFIDVTDSSSYYFDAAKWALGKGLLNGVSKVSEEKGFKDTALWYENNKLGVGHSTTRAEFLDMLWRLNGMQGENAKLGWYSDVETGFGDVSTHSWYAPALKWAKDLKIVGGYSDGTVHPNDNLNKGQIIVMLWRAAGMPTVASDVKFSDVKDSDYFSKAAKWAAESGVLFDIGDNFDAGSLCTNEQVVTYLYRYSQYLNRTSNFDNQILNYSFSN